MKMKYPFYLLILSIFFYGCEYDSGKSNFHDLPAPEEDITVNVDLLGLNPKDIIYIYAKTNLAYNINISSGKIVKYNFFLDNIKLASNNNQLTINPYYLDNQIHKLVLKLDLTSDTESLEEIFGGEKSYKEIEFNLKYVNTDGHLNIAQKKNDEGYLEIYWDEPKIEGLKIEKYDIYSYDEHNEVLKESITDPHSSYYIDKSYVYGVKTYKIVTTFAEEGIKPWEDFYTVKYIPFTPEMFTTEITKDFKLKIKWNNPNGYNCQYVFVWEGNTTRIEKGKNEIEVERDIFPTLQTYYYDLYVLPDDDNWYINNKVSIKNYYRENILEEIDPNQAHLVIAADIKNRLLLALRPSSYSYSHHNLKRYNINTLEFKDEVSIQEGDYQYYPDDIRVAENGRVGIHYRVNSDYTKQPIIIIYEDNSCAKRLSRYRADIWPVWSLSADERLYLRNSDTRVSYIYDVKNGKLSHTLKEAGSEFRTSVSPSGKYFFNYLRIDNKWYKLYKNDNGNITLLNSNLQSDITNIEFNPANEKYAVFCHGEESFSIYEIPNLRKVTTIKGGFVKFDPFTGNILYQDIDFLNNSKIHILNKDYDKNLLSFTVKQYYFYPLYTYLFNNYLFIRDYYVKLPI